MWGRRMAAGRTLLLPSQAEVPLLAPLFELLAQGPHLLSVLLACCAGAGIDLVKKAGGNVVEAAAVIDLGLGGRQKLPEGLSSFVLVEKELDE